MAESVRRAQAAGRSWPLPDTLDETALARRVLATAAKTSAARRPTPDWATVPRARKRQGVTVVLLWHADKALTPDGRQYSQCCAAYRVWAGQLDLVMRHSHRAGETLLVDNAGQTMPVVNPLTGEVHAAALVIAVVGASNSTCAAATWSPSLPAWSGSHVRAFAALGGVPQILVPEHLTAAGSRGPRSEPALTRTTADLAQHSGVAVLPARARRPSDTATVAVGVQVGARWMLVRRRHHTLCSLLELHTAITALLVALPQRPVKQRPGSRQRGCESLARPALRPLPAQPYEDAEWPLVRVTIDSHVEVAGHSASVPSSVVKPPLAGRRSAQVVDIFHQGNRVASHQRSPLKGRHSTGAAHMPQAHRSSAAWTPHRLVLWAANTGKATAQVGETLLASRPHPPQGFRACWGIMRLGQREGEGASKPPAGGPSSSAPVRTSVSHRCSHTTLTGSPGLANPLPPP